MEDRQEIAIGGYELSVRKKYRSRGGWILETGTGPVLLREYENISSHFAIENQVKTFLVKNGFTGVDIVIPNREGELVTELETGEKYVIYQWFSGEECNLKSEKCLAMAGANLGQLHRILKDFSPVQEEEQTGTGEHQSEELLEQFHRHNRELKRVNTYMKNKKRKNEFEIYAINCFETFYSKACQAAERLEKSSYYEEMKEGVGQFCHSDYNYHNLILEGNRVATIGFEKVGYGIPLLDLTYFMRKTLEKNAWRATAGEAVLKGYETENPLTQGQREFVEIMLMYPEKYWKLMNRYYNKKKSWLSGKSLEKLEDVRRLEASREKFLHSFFEKE